MQEIILDFTNCKYLYGIHEELKNKFDFPDYYGRNLDALWDVLDNYCSWELRVYVKGVDSLPKDVQEYMTEIFNVFDDVHKSTPNITFEVIS